jgi:hypothetical protein
MKHLCCLLLLALSCASVVAAPRVSVTTDTNGVLVAPIGFFQANSQYIQEMIDTAVGLASTNAVWPKAGQGTTAETNGYTVTINADVTLQVATNIAKAAAEVATNGLGTAAQVTAASNVVHSALIASNALLQAQIAASTNSAATIGLINTASNQLSAALVATNSLLLSQIFATTNGMATKEAITNSILALTDSPTNFILNTAGYPTNSGAYVTNGGTANVTATNATALNGKSEDELNVASAQTANTATNAINAGKLGDVPASEYALKNAPELTSPVLLGEVVSTNLLEKMTNAALDAIAMSPSVFATDTSTGLVLNVTKTLIVPTNIQTSGLVLDGVTKTNWGLEQVQMQFINVGPDVAMETLNTNNQAYLKPALSDSADKATNYANYTYFIPTDLDPSFNPIIQIIGSKTGTAGNAVLSLQFAQATTFPGSFAGEVLSTNAFSGAGTRAAAHEIPTPWTLASGIVTIQIARDGDDNADTLVNNLNLQAVYLLYRRR